MSIARLDRRRFLQLFGSTAISTSFGYSACIAAECIAGKPPLSNADLNWTLNVTGNHPNFSYNDKSTGPIITASAGDTIQVELINRLPPRDDDCTSNVNIPHGFNTTNLHTHGLHVSPEKDKTGQFDADNVLLKVVPEQQDLPCCDPTLYRRGSNTFRFDVPADHPPGTHWYHAHKHGSTAIQVARGLAGPLIIKDPPGFLPDYIANAPERIFMITFSNGVIEVQPEGGGDQSGTIQLAPGAVERWRIINAHPASNAFFKLNVDSSDVELFQIAFDGLTLTKRVKIEIDDDDDAEPWLSPAVLAPGNRTDLMIRVKDDAAAGNVALTAQQLPSKYLHLDQAADLALGATAIGIAIEIEGASVEAEWQDDPTLPGPGLSYELGTILETRHVKFSGTTKINDESFGADPNKPMFQMKLDTTEEWRLSNESDAFHPFHIHVNPFFVTHINDVELDQDSPLRRWQDTIAIPEQVDDTPGSITFQTRFVDFTGVFVIHCHILDHEDKGMMRIVEVVEN